MWQEFTEVVREEHARLDGDIAVWKQEFEAAGGRVHCRKGCGNCCRLAVHASLPEALAVAGTLTAGQIATLSEYASALPSLMAEVTDLKNYLRQVRRRTAGCPFLDRDGACGVYEVRPLACRSLISTRNSDWCGVDLGELHPMEQRAFLSGLDRASVAYPTHYACAPQEFARRREASLAEGMKSSFGGAVGGNFPYLVWLVREHGLAGRVAGNVEQVAEFLAGKGLAHPFLVHIDGIGGIPSEADRRGGENA